VPIPPNNITFWDSAPTFIVGPVDIKGVWHINVTATIPLNNVTSILDSNITVGKMIILYTIGNYGPPKFSTSDPNLIVPTEIQAEINNITII
jgi:hypothetical protein